MKGTSPSGQIEIRPAISDADREAVYRFRYEVFIQEMGVEQQHANHTDKIIQEPCDDLSMIIAAWNLGAIVGTVRVQISADDALAGYDELLRMTEFSPLYHPRHTSMTTKLMVHTALRGSSLTMRLARACFEYGLTRDVYFDFIHCRDDTRHFFERLGYKQLFQDVRLDYGQAHPMVLCLRDKAELELVSSPFASLLKEHHYRPDAVAFFNHLYYNNQTKQ